MDECPQKRNLAVASSLNIFIMQLIFSRWEHWLTFVGQNPITLLLLDPVESNKYFPFTQAVKLLYDVLCSRNIFIISEIFITLAE